MHRVHTDVVRGILDSRSLGEDSDCTLGGVIGSGARTACDSRDGRNIYDRGATRFAHLRYRVLGPQEDPFALIDITSSHS